MSTEANKAVVHRLASEGDAAQDVQKWVLAIFVILSLLLLEVLLKHAPNL